jgi:GT2 family glycosyltransferase
MKKTPLFSVILVNYRSAHLMYGALRSLPESWQREIIVVNNDREEEELLRTLRDEIPFTLVSCSGNRGFGAANNEGALSAQGEYLFFLNPDTLWQWGTFSEAAQFLDRHRKVGIVGAKIVDQNGLPEKWSAGMPVSLSELVKNNLGLSSGRRIWESDRPIGAGFVSGAAMIVRKELFDALGGFDEDYFLYFEDVDLCYRARKLGFNVAFDPDIVIRHLGGASHESYSKQKGEFYRSQRLYFEKHRPKEEAGILRALRFLQKRHAA